MRAKRFNGGARLYARKLDSWNERFALYNLLQWGRAIVRAQAEVPVRATAERRRASMGARDCTRASSSAGCCAGGSSSSFNGGARLYARKPRKAIRSARPPL